MYYHLKGHNVSHANNKTKRRFLPNLKKITFKSDILKRNIRLNVSNAALRSVDFKGGLDKFLLKAKTKKSFKTSKKNKGFYIFSKIILMLKDKKKVFYILSVLMGLVVILSNYLVQFPMKFAYYGLENLLTYGAFSYPITFLITDLANRAYGKKRARIIILIGFFIGIVLTLFVSTNFEIQYLFVLLLDQQQLF